MIYVARRNKPMTKEDLIETLESIEYAFKTTPWNNYSEQEIIDWILDVETELFRARIKAERELNSK